MKTIYWPKYSTPDWSWQKTNDIIHANNVRPKWECERGSTQGAPYTTPLKLGEVCSYTSFLHCIHNTPCESWPPTLIKSSRKLSLTMGCISYCTHILHIMIQNEWKMKHRCSTNVNVSLLAPSFISWIYHYNVMFGKSGTLDKEA